MFHVKHFFIIFKLWYFYFFKNTKYCGIFLWNTADVKCFTWNISLLRWNILFNKGLLLYWYWQEQSYISLYYTLTTLRQKSGKPPVPRTRGCVHMEYIHVHFCLYEHYIVISSLNNFAVRQIQINLYFSHLRSLYRNQIISNCKDGSLCTICYF